MAMTIPRVAPLRLRIQKAATDYLTRAKATTRLARARAGYAAGMVTSAWGVGVLFGLGWALLAGGLVTSWSFLHLYPVDEQ
jgi:hypothetical protein